MSDTSTLEAIDWDALGCALRPEPLNELAYYSINNTNDHLAVQGMIRRCIDLNIWMQHIPDDDEDFELYARKMSSTFGVSVGYVRAAVFGIIRLRELPETNVVFHRLCHLDIDRLIGINNTLDKLGPIPDPDMMQRIDLELSLFITPTRCNQRMPSRRSITNFLNELIALEDSSLPNGHKNRSYVTALVTPENKPLSNCRWTPKPAPSLTHASKTLPHAKAYLMPKRPSHC